MQKLITISITAILLFLSQATMAEKYALVVAIGDYPDPGKNGWGKISSANDLPLVKTALEKQGFKPENIATLQDAAATKEGIQQAFDALLAKVHAGDVVVIHFSSHGEQIEDDNNEEIDHLDETIVPYGAVYSYDKAKFITLAPGYFRDDEFGEKVTQLRNKLTGKGDLLVLLDACHSGTGTRGVSELQPRGAKEPMVSDKFDLTTVQPDVNGVFKDNNGTKLAKDAATYVVISGAQAKEFNYECYDDNGKPVGSLSYAFSKSVSQLNDKTSYRGLFAQIENIMRDKAPRQKPVLEGDGIDRSLFGGAFVSQKPYFTVKRWNTGSEFVLDAGSVAGVTEGSIVSLYPAGTADPTGKTALNKGKVTTVSNFDATVTLEKEDTLFKSSPWVFVTEMNYGSKIKIDVRDVNHAGRRAYSIFQNSAIVEYGKPCDIYLDTLGSIDSWALKYPTTGTVFEKGLTLDNTNGINEALKRFARYRYLQGLEFAEDGLDASISLVFLKPTGEIDNDKINSRTVNGRLELVDGDQVYLKVVNTGNKGFFVNVVDIQPDGKINPILPNKKQGIRPEDCEIRKYDSLVLKSYKITIGLPAGEEVFKVFLSKDKLDLEDILVTGDDRASRSRGVLNNMAKVFVESDSEQRGTRGASGQVNTDQNGTIFNVNFIIKEKGK
jgi:metacaspase-1